MNKIDSIISDLETQIRWIEDIECHQFPGWMNTTYAMRYAVALLKEQEQMYYTLEHDWRMCRELLKEQEAVVRCKDCKHGEDWGVLIACGKARGFGLTHDKDWFCADGVKKDA